MEVIYATGDINRFLDGLEAGIRSQVARLIEVLTVRGHELRLPHSRALGSGLFELRLNGKHAVRLLYCYAKGKAYIVHALMKKQGALPRSDIVYAQRVREMVVADT